MIIEGVEFSVAYWIDIPEVELQYRYTSTPYSSRILGDSVDPFVVEVGGYGGPYGITSEIRGMAEFQLSGSVDSAILTFDVFREGGMYYSGSYTIPPYNPDPFTGTILMDAYVGDAGFDLFTDWMDYTAPSRGDVGDFFVTPGIMLERFTFDVTSIWNEAVVDGLTTLGIRLAQERSGEYGTNKAWSFSNFEVETTIPEPSTLALVLIGVWLATRRLK